jgi:hypothetical protein
MGFLDFILGRRSSGDDIGGEIEREERKTYGDLYSGGAGRANREIDEDSPEEEIERDDPKLDRKVSRLGDDLRNIERRARDLHVYNDPQVRKKIGKVESSIGGMSDAGNSRSMSTQNAKLRLGLRKGYSEIKRESEQRLEKLRRDGASERHIREEEHKLGKIRGEMSSMFRRSGGSGMLK